MLRLIAGVLMACVTATPSFALPSLKLVQTGATTGRLDVTVTGSGSIAAEIALTDAGAYSLTNVAINSAIFDTANPGDSPFIAGSPEGGDSAGLTFEPDLGRAFAAFGSGVVSEAGPYTFLTFEYIRASQLPVGLSGFIASGKVAQDGVLTTIPQVVSGVIVDDFDFDGNGYMGNGDLTLVLANWGKAVPPVPAGWIGGSQPTAPNIGND